MPNAAFEKIHQEASLARRRNVQPLIEAPRWTVRRPPSEESIVLYYAMVHVWTCLFEPAAGCAIVALVLLLCAVAQAQLVDSLGSALNAYTLTAIAGFVAMGVAAVYYHFTQPNLGTQD